MNENKFQAPLRCRVTHREYFQVVLGTIPLLWFHSKLVNIEKHASQGEKNLEAGKGLPGPV